MPYPYAHHPTSLYTPPPCPPPYTLHPIPCTTHPPPHFPVHLMPHPPPHSHTCIAPPPPPYTLDSSPRPGPPQTEVFVVKEGTAAFVVRGVHHMAERGQEVVVPPGVCVGGRV